MAGHDAAFAIADEDLERENGEKTSLVHFLRFELEPAMIAALGTGGALAVGIDHPACRVAVDPVPEVIRSSLCGDLHA